MRARRTLTIAAIVVTVATLAACGSDPEQNVPGPNFATATGSGESIDIASDIVRADYPNACRLLPDDTVQGLLGAPATSDNNASGCAWSTGRASYPSLQVSWIELGSRAEQVYDERLAGESVGQDSSIGERARLYRVNEGMTARADVLQPRAFFRVEVQTVTTANHDIVVAQQIAVRVAQLVADQVN